VTIAEIRYGIERLPTADRSRRRLEAWLTNELRPWFAERLLDVDEDVFIVWRRLVEKGKPCVIPSLSLIYSSQRPRSCTTFAS
jgi:predicted nucleic acid-binding protein